MFTGPDGLPLHPGYLTQRLRLLVDRAELPPIRLHDLRHGAATLTHAAGADMKSIQDQLGHATIRLTADIYTTVLPAAARDAAEATAAYLIAASKPGAAVMMQIERTRDGNRRSPTVASGPYRCSAASSEGMRDARRTRMTRRRTYRTVRTD